jgi:hypothetical protein
LDDLKKAIRQKIRPIDRQLLACVVDDFKKKKALKLHPRRLSVVILPISFLKLSHLVRHVLRFNFVYINVNLLEKQLSTVYFKYVRFPWVTLYVVRRLVANLLSAALLYS